MESQKTLVMLKPKPEIYTWEYQEFFLNLTSEYIDKVWCIVSGEKIKKFSEEEAILHYYHLRFVKFFPEIVRYITSWESILLQVEWENSIKKMLEFKKETRENFNCNPWLFDWIYNKKPIYNILHCSDSEREAKREVDRYFWK